MIKRDGGYREEIWDEPYGGEGKLSVVRIGEVIDHGNPFFDSMSRVTVQPGVKVGRHSHEGKTELLYIVSGRCSYNDGEPHLLLPGDSAIVRGADAHRLENPGPEPLVYLAVIVMDEVGGG